MEIFEDQFKTKAQGNATDVSKMKMKVVQKTPSKTSLIDANKAKNLAITLRKGGMNPANICTAIETYVCCTADLLPSSQADSSPAVILQLFVSAGTTSSLCP